MRDLDIFTIRELRSRTGDLVSDAQAGRLSVITRHGRPALLAVPFTQSLLELGVDRALAVKMFEQGLVTLSKAARFAGVTMEEFLDVLKQADVDAVDYPVEELEQELP
jgi:predicted HTH domain antitoxin